MTNNVAIIYPSFHLDDKSKWDTVEFLGREFKTPYKPRLWLEFYYGSGWQQPNQEWTCHQNAKNVIPYTSISDLDSIEWRYNYHFVNES